MADSGKQLREHNEQIVQYINQLKTQRDDIIQIIEKQQIEKIKIEKELERLVYKLDLVRKGLAKRIKSKNNYDKTIVELEGMYANLVENSNRLLLTAQTEYTELEQMMDKKVNTEVSNLQENVKRTNKETGEGVGARMETEEPQKITREDSLKEAFECSKNKNKSGVEVYKAGYETQHKPNPKHNNQHRD